ncbi:MAG TPA: FecR family protein [Armatimonadota bacterium]|nr:FecR family protein [Armatimonadota bacterium]
MARSSRTAYVAALLALAASAMGAQPAMAAPEGRISAALNQVLARSAATGKFVTGRVGVVLVNGDSVRTGPRSAAAITFTDGTRLRIGELSELTVHPGNYHNVHLSSGSVFAEFKGPGTISGRSAVAAVRGTKMMLSVGSDGDTVSDYSDGPGSHEIDVVRAPADAVGGIANTINGDLLQSANFVGDTQNWTGAILRIGSGTASQIRHVTAFDAVTGTFTLDAPINGVPLDLHFSLILPANAYFVTLHPGQETNVPSTPGSQPTDPHSTPDDNFPQGDEYPIFFMLIDGQTITNHLMDNLHGRTQRDEYEANVARQAGDPVSLLSPGIQTGEGAPGGFPPDIHHNGGTTGTTGTTGTGGVGVTVPGGTTGPGGVGVTVPGGGSPGGVGVTVPGGGSQGGVGVTVPGGSTGPGGTVISIQGGGAPGSVGVSIPGGSGLGGVGTTLPTTGAGDVVVVVGQSPTRVARAGLAGLAGLTRAVGVTVGNPEVIGAAYQAGDNGTLFAHTNEAVIVGDFYLRAGFRGGTLAGDDQTAVDEAMVHYRNKGIGDLQAGRFHWFPGPVSTNTLGRLISFYTADGAIYRPPIPGPVSIDAAYFARINPLEGPIASGYAARVSGLVKSASVGVTTLFGSVAPGHVGISFDAALPVVPHKLEVYGEVGRDLLDERLYTGGIYLPYFYNKFKTDFYLEYAHRQNFGSETDLSAYFPVLRYFNVLATLRKLNANKWQPGLGLISHF